VEDRRLIEVDFPLKEVSEESASEKSIRHGHISTLHIWWARRPLAASRATTFAALVPAPDSEEQLKKRIDLVINLSKWENSNNLRLTSEASKIMRERFGEKAPKVLDCFAGGGSIPLESLRLGCQTYALELNPVAFLILKAVLEYPQKYGRVSAKVSGGLSKAGNPLMEDVRKWGNWTLQETRKEIEKFYPKEPDGNNTVGYIWARTIPCQNPRCGTEIPLLRHFWLADTENKKVALKMVIKKASKEIAFKVVQGKEIDFDPSERTTSRATVLCPVCSSAIDDKTTRSLARQGKMGHRLIAIILGGPFGKGYRTASEGDRAVYDKARKYLSGKIRDWMWDFNPVPDEKMPPIGTYGVDAQRYTQNQTWGELFNARQLIALITFVEKVKLAYDRMLKEGYDKEYAKAIATYLGLGVDWAANKNSTIVIWAAGRESTTQTFNRSAIPMIWDYVEINPFSGSTGGWESLWDFQLRVIDNCSKVSGKAAQVVSGTAIRLPFEDNFFDAIVTDPPYYDNVPYSDLSDFFYVWLKRSIGNLYPDLFSTPLTPKSQEIILNPIRHDNNEQTARQFFEDMLTQSFKEIHRVLKPDGIGVIVFAHKTTEAWEAVINSILKSGLVLSASWPIKTERTGRLRAHESASLASSIYMVCRKRTKEEVTYFNEIRNEVEQRIKEKLNKFWTQGIRGADFFISAIGPAVEVFGKYSKVEKLSGEEVTVRELLEHSRKIVCEFASETIGNADKETKFYYIWRKFFNSMKVHFDDARKLSQAIGVELTQLWDGGSLVRKEKEFVRVLDPKERAKDATFLKKIRYASMIDVLHHVVVLWERGEKERIKTILNETGYGGNEVFWQTAQAISEVLPQGDKEKQLLQGFLYGKETYIKETSRGSKTLLDFAESG